MNETLAAFNAKTWILLQSFSGYTRSIDASSVVKKVHGGTLMLDLEALMENP